MIMLPLAYASGSVTETNIQLIVFPNNGNKGTLLLHLEANLLEYGFMSLVVGKPVFGVSDQVPHKPGCTATEDGWMLEISYLGRREIVLSV